jgi:hypothetical protein
MNQKELLEQQRKNEEQQEENRSLKALLERNIAETEQLFAWERRHNERVLSYFHRQEEGHYFDEITEDSRRAEQRFFDEITDGQDQLAHDNRRLDKENDLLYETRLQLLKEEAEADG